MKFHNIIFLCFVTLQVNLLKNNPQQGQTNFCVTINKDKRQVDIFQNVNQQIIKITSKNFSDCLKNDTVKINVPNQDQTFNIIENKINKKFNQDDFLIDYPFEIESIDGFCDQNYLNIQILPKGNQSQIYKLTREDNQNERVVNFKYILGRSKIPLISIKVTNLQSKINGYLEQTFLSNTGEILFNSTEQSKDAQPLIPQTFLNNGQNYMATSISYKNDMKYIAFPVELDFTKVNIYQIESIIESKQIKTELKFGTIQGKNIIYQTIIQCNQLAFTQSNINFKFQYDMKDELSQRQSLSFVKDYRISETVKVYGLIPSTINPQHQINCEASLQITKHQHNVNVVFTQEGIARVQRKTIFKSVLDNLSMDEIQELDESPLKIQEIDSAQNEQMNQNWRQNQDNSLDQNSILQGSINTIQSQISQKSNQKQQIPFKDRQGVQEFMENKNLAKEFQKGSFIQDNQIQDSNGLLDESIQIPQQNQKTEQFQDIDDMTAQRFEQALNKNNQLQNNRKTFQDYGKNPIDVTKKFQFKNKANINNRNSVLDLKRKTFNTSNNNSIQTQANSFKNFQQNKNKINEKSKLVDLNQNSVNQLDQMLSNDNDLRNTIVSQDTSSLWSQDMFEIVFLQDIDLMYKQKQFRCTTHYQIEDLIKKTQIKIYTINFQEKYQFQNIQYYKKFKDKSTRARIQNQQVVQYLDDMIDKDIDCQLEISNQGLLLFILPKDDKQPHISILKHNQIYYLNGSVNQRRFQCQRQIDVDDQQLIFLFQSLRDTATDDQNKQQVDLNSDILQVNDNLKKIIILDQFEDNFLFSCNFDTSLLNINCDQNKKCEQVNIKLVQTSQLSQQYIMIETFIKKYGIAINVVKQNVALQQEQLNKNFEQIITNTQIEKTFLISEVLEKTNIQEFDFDFNQLNENQILIFFKGGNNILDQYNLRYKLLEVDNCFFYFLQLLEKSQTVKVNIYYIFKYQGDQLQIAILFKKSQKNANFLINVNEEDEILEFMTTFDVKFTVLTPDNQIQQIQQKTIGSSQYYANIAQFQNVFFNDYEDFDIQSIDKVGHNLNIVIMLKKTKII